MMDDKSALKSGPAGDPPLRDLRPVTKHLADLRSRLWAPAPVIIWFFLVFCALAFFGWPFSLVGFLALVAVYLWVAWAAPSSAL